MLRSGDVVALLLWMSRSTEYIQASLGADVSILWHIPAVAILAAHNSAANMLYCSKLHQNSMLASALLQDRCWSKQQNTIDLARQRSGNICWQNGQMSSGSNFCVWKPLALHARSHATSHTDIAAVVLLGVQAQRMVQCVCGTVLHTVWRTTSTTAWSGCGLWLTSRAPTSKPAACFGIRVCCQSYMQRA